MAGLESSILLIAKRRATGRGRGARLSGRRAPARKSSEEAKSLRAKSGTLIARVLPSDPQRAGSRDSSAIKRRAHIIVDGIMSGILNECPALGLGRLVAHLAWARTICSLRFGWYRAAADTALFGFARLYERPGRDRRAQLVNVLCMTFDEALSAGREGEIDPERGLRRWIDTYGKPDSPRLSFERA